MPDKNEEGGSELLALFVASALNRLLKAHTKDITSSKVHIGITEFLKTFHHIAAQYVSKHRPRHFPAKAEDISINRIVGLITTDARFSRFVTIINNALIVEIVPDAYEKWINDIVLTSTKQYSQLLLKYINDLLHIYHQEKQMMEPESLSQNGTGTTVTEIEPIEDTGDVLESSIVDEVLEKRPEKLEVIPEEQPAEEEESDSRLKESQDVHESQLLASDVEMESGSSDHEKDTVMKDAETQNSDMGDTEELNIVEQTPKQATTEKDDSTNKELESSSYITEDQEMVVETESKNEITEPESITEVNYSNVDDDNHIKEENVTGDPVPDPHEDIDKMEVDDGDDKNENDVHTGSVQPSDDIVDSSPEKHEVEDKPLHENDSEEDDEASVKEEKEHEEVEKEDEEEVAQEEEESVLEAEEDEDESDETAKEGVCVQNIDNQEEVEREETEGIETEHKKEDNDEEVESEEAESDEEEIEEDSEEENDNDDTEKRIEETVPTTRKSKELKTESTEININSEKESSTDSTKVKEENNINERHDRDDDGEADEEDHETSLSEDLNDTSASESRETTEEPADVLVKHEDKIEENSDDEGTRRHDSRMGSNRKRSRSPSSAASQHKRFQNIAVNLINSILEHRFSSPFLHPVSKKDAPDYNDVIYEPKDLKNILKAIKLKQDPPAYSEIKQLERDIILMFANCIMFNRSDEDLVSLTLSMKNDVNKMFKLFEEAEEDIK